MGTNVKIKEEVITVDQDTAVGILTHRQKNEERPTIVFFNAGMIHRIGPNRIHVKLARKLSNEGYDVFRFDLGGQGDSIALPEHTTEAIIRSTLNLLQKKTGCNEFILIGMCSGAEEAFTTALNDNRIKGVVMVNGTGLPIDIINKLYPTAEKNLQVRYYKKSLAKKDRWIKLLKGKSKALNIRNLSLIFRRLFKRRAITPTHAAVNIPTPFDQLSPRNTALLMILAEGSAAFDLVHFAYGVNCMQSPNCIIMKDVDHTITPVWAQEEMFSYIIQWCNNQ